MLGGTSSQKKYNRKAGVILLGDSILDAYFSSPNAANLISVASDYFTDITFYDFAHAGYQLVTADGTSAYMRSDTGVASDWYNTLKGLNVGITPNILVLSLGTNDVASGYTQPQWTGYYESLIAQVLTDYPSIQHVIVRILGRHTLNNTYAFDLRRASQWDVITNNTCGKIAGASEIYHVEIDESGGVHPSTAGYTQLARELCAQCWALLKNGTMTGYKGPSISSASLSDNTITLTIAPDNADTLNEPSLSESMFTAFITENGVESTVVPTACASPNKTTVTLTLPTRLQGTSPKLYHGYKTLYGLDRVSPPAIKGRPELYLPLQLAKPTITIPASADVVKNISGLQYDFDPHNNAVVLKTGTSTFEVDSLASINGRKWNNVDAAHNPVLVANASGGKTGMKSVTNGAQMKPDIVAQASAARVMVCACIMPAAVSGSIMFQFGTTAADVQAGFSLSAAASGTLFWGRNTANGFVSTKTGVLSQKAIVAIVIDADGTANLYYNNPLVPTVTDFLPKANYASDTALYLFGSSTANALLNLTIMRAIDVYGTLGGANPTLENIFTQFNTDYAFGLSW